MSRRSIPTQFRGHSCPAALDGTLLTDQHDGAPTHRGPYTAGGAISTPGDLAVYVKALVGGGLLDQKFQKLRLDSVRPTAPGQPGGSGLRPWHRPALPRTSTAMTDKSPDIRRSWSMTSSTTSPSSSSTNLAASPVDGEKRRSCWARPSSWTSMVMGSELLLANREGVDGPPSSNCRLERHLTKCICCQSHLPVTRPRGEGCLQHRTSVTRLCGHVRTEVADDRVPTFPWAPRFLAESLGR